MTIIWSQLPRVFFSPKKAFANISKKATIADGIILTLIFAVIGGAVGLMINLWRFPEFYDVATTAGSTVLGIVLNLVIFVIFGFIAAFMAKAFEGTGNRDKTIGNIGYVGVIGFILGLVVAPIASLGQKIVTEPLLGQPVVTYETWALVLIIVLALITFIWEWIVAGYAVGAANKISMGKGMLAVLLAALVTFAIALVGVLVFGIFYIMAVWPVLPFS